MRDFAPLYLAFAPFWEFFPVGTILLEMIRIRVETILAEMELMFISAMRNTTFQRSSGEFRTIFREMFGILVFALFAKMLLMFYLASFDFAFYGFLFGISIEWALIFLCGRYLVLYFMVVSW